MDGKRLLAVQKFDPVDTELRLFHPSAGMRDHVDHRWKDSESVLIAELQVGGSVGSRPDTDTQSKEHAVALHYGVLDGEEGFAENFVEIPEVSSGCIFSQLPAGTRLAVLQPNREYLQAAPDSSDRGLLKSNSVLTLGGHQRTCFVRRRNFDRQLFENAPYLRD